MVSLAGAGARVHVHVHVQVLQVAKLFCGIK